MYPLRNVLKRVIIDRNDMLTRSKTQQRSRYAVQHDPSAGKFYINLNGGSAFVQYEKLANIYHLYDTQVPEQYRGQGIGKILAKNVFDYAIKDHNKIQLSCSYLQKYYHENYETYKNHVLDDDIVEH